MINPLAILYKTLYLISFYSFIILPPIIYTTLIFIASVSNKWKILIVIINTVGGWFLVNFSLFMAYQYKMYYANLYDNFRDMPTSVQQIVNNGPTGASLGFGLLFGYLYMPFLSLVLYPFYKIIKSRYQKNKEKK